MKIKTITALFLILFFLFSCTNSSNMVTKSYIAMGTACSVSINQKKVDRAIFDKIEDRLIDIENKMSIHREDSEVSNINKNGFSHPVKVSADTYYVIKTGYYYSKLSNGVFDITVGPIVKLWNVTGENPKIPTEVEITSTLERVGYENILFDDETMSVSLKREGVVIDLGAIAKGYAADEVKNILMEYGIKSAIINLGGNVFVMGEKEDGVKWRVGIQNPLKDDNEYIVTIEASDETIVTSGGYERFFKSKGKVYHHIFDTKSGYPKENDILSVTVVTKSSIKADALSTTLFLFGSSDGLNFLKQFDGVDAIFITKDKSIIITDNIENRVTIEDF